MNINTYRISTWGPCGCDGLRRKQGPSSVLCDTDKNTNILQATAMKGHLSHGSISMMLLLHQLHLQSCPVLPLKGYDLSRPITEWTQCLDIVWSRKKTQSLEPTPKFPNRRQSFKGAPLAEMLCSPHAVSRCPSVPCMPLKTASLQERSWWSVWRHRLFFPPSPTLASVTLWLILLLLNPSWFILLFPHLVRHPYWAMSSDLPILEFPITCLPMGHWGIAITFRQLWDAGLDHLTACS